MTQKEIIELIRPKIQNKGSVSGSVTFDLSLYTHFTLSASADITAVFTNLKTPCYVLIEFTQTVGAVTITNLPDAIIWDSAWGEDDGDITIIGGMYNGVTWTWEYKVAPTGTGGAGSSDIVFDSVSGFTQSGTVWTPGAGSFNTSKASYSHVMPLASNARILWQPMPSGGFTGAGFSTIFAVNPSAALNNLSNYPYGAYFDATSFYRIDGGSQFFTSSVTLGATDLVSLNKVSTVMTVELSTNGGTSWSVLHTFSTAITADLFPIINSATGGIVTDPKGIGLV